MTLRSHWRRWARELVIVLGAQLLFWGIYAFMLWKLHPTPDLSDSHLSTASARLSSLTEPVGAYAPGLTQPAILRLPGWHPTVLYPERASLLLRADANDGVAASLTCLASPCGTTQELYIAALGDVEKAASLERLQSKDMVWVTTMMGLILGTALLVLLPISRFALIHIITGLFLILVGSDAWLTAFGAVALPYAWFPVLRYGVQYAVMTGLSLLANAFAGWRSREAWATCACYSALMLVVIATLLSEYDIKRVVPPLNLTALTFTLVFGSIALLRLARTSPGPAMRVLAMLLIAVSSVIWDLFLHPQTEPLLKASVLAPALLMFAVLLEITLQSHRLNQEADEARNDIERQALEQDAVLLRSSPLLRHQERQIAVNIERQRLLRDMHDGVGGMLTHLLLDLREHRLGDAEIEQHLQAALDDLRNIASAIDADQEPLDEALTIFHERMRVRLARSAITLDWRCQLPLPAPSLDARRLLNLQRLLQEGIANALRHSGASRIELVAKAMTDNTLLITLRDDGAGFDPASAKSALGEGRGLINMRRRAEQMGGKLRIESAPGQGTRLLLTIPVQ